MCGSNTKYCMVHSVLISRINDLRKKEERIPQKKKKRRKEKGIYEKKSNFLVLQRLYSSTCLPILQGYIKQFPWWEYSSVNWKVV